MRRGLWSLLSRIKCGQVYDRAGKQQDAGHMECLASCRFPDGIIIAYGTKEVKLKNR